MIRASYLLLKKDLALSLQRGTGLLHAILLGLLLIFLLSLAAEAGTPPSPRTAATVFWMATAFCQVLVFSSLYGLEEGNGQRQCLLLAPVPSQAIWLGKSAAGFCLVCIIQSALLLATLVFLRQTFMGHLLISFAGTLLINLGCAALNSLLGALAQAGHAKESLLSIIVFPLLLPLFLAGITLLTAAFSGSGSPDIAWVKLILAFDAVFIGAAYILFPFVYSPDA